MKEAKQAPMAINTAKQIEKAFNNFKKDLKDDELPILELILIDGTKITVTDIVYFNPHLLHITGFNSHQNEYMTALVHQNTLQFIMRKVKHSGNSEDEITSENLEFMYQ